MNTPTTPKPLYGPPVASVQDPSSEGLAQRLRGPTVGALLAALTIYLAFNAGGFFPGPVADAAIVVSALSVLGVMLISRPFGSFTVGLLVPLCGLSLFAAWTLLSALWSDAAGRALIEFDRALLYVLVLALFGMFVPGRQRLRWGLRGFAAAALAICLAGWISRVAADVWPIAPDVHPERLSFPLTYWNAMGLLAALALVAVTAISSSGREPRWARAAAAGAMPLLASVLLLTFSRASLALVPLAILLFALLARSRRSIATLIAAGIPVAVALVASYRSGTVSSDAFGSPAGVHQGHELMLVVLICVAVAAALRALLAVDLDRRLEEWIPPVFEPRNVLAALAAAVAILCVGLIAIGAPGWVGREYNAFVDGDIVGHDEDPQARLVSVGNDGRIPQWRVSLDGFKEEPLTGTGAGTYQLEWSKRRPHDYTVIDAHSLYAEVLGELGIVGFLLISGTVLAILVGLARRIRGEDRQLYAAVFTMAVLWAVHAGVDWDWEMPVVTLWLFALAGLGLSKPADEPATAGLASFEPGRMVRIVAALCIGVLAITPAAIAVSQSRLDTAVADYEHGDCGPAIDSALGSLEALKVRPEPYEVIGYCDISLAQPRLAVLAMRNAVDRDPENWETHYGLALALAANRQNPMPELYASLRRNPLEKTIRETIEAMRGARPGERERRALGARLPV